VVTREMKVIIHSRRIPGEASRRSFDGKPQNSRVKGKKGRFRKGGRKPPRKTASRDKTKRGKFTGKAGEGSNTPSGGGTHRKNEWAEGKTALAAKPAKKKVFPRKAREDPKKT